MRKRTDWVAVAIDAAVVLAVMPRWIPALMRSEGFTIPEDWLSWWIPVSAVMNGAMAVTEAVAIAYIFSAWHKAEGREAKRLLILTVMLLASFSLVLMPFIASSIVGVDMSVVLASPGQYFMALIWATAVVLSTGITVMAVGVAQASHGEIKAVESELRCWCGYIAESEDDLTDHYAGHIEEVQEHESSREALDALQRRYLDRRNGVLPPLPTLADVARMRKNSFAEVAENDRTD